MNRAFRFASFVGITAALATQACNGLTSDDGLPPPPPPASSADTGAVGSGPSAPGPVDLGPADSGALDSACGNSQTPDGNPPIALPGAPHTLAEVPLAYGVACSPDAIYAGTTDGKIFAVPLSAPTPAALTPAPAGVVGYLAWAGGHLFYTLPGQGEVHARDLAGGGDIVLAAKQPHPRGIAVSGTDVFFATDTTVSTVASHTANQTAIAKVTFADVGWPQPQGSGLGLALSGVRYVVLHSPATDAGGNGSGSLATYTSTGQQLTYYSFFSETIGVAASATLDYWSQTDGTIYSGPKDMSNGLSPARVVQDQTLLGDICLQNGRLYFTAMNENDVREIRYADVE